MKLQIENLFKRTGFDNPNGGSPFRDSNIKGEAGKGPASTDRRARQEASVAAGLRLTLNCS